ncbi:hypothetical protein D9V41_13315 [Aeromicrobium phragmitis]|uniref:LPXTG cell wall anchor domain-containing protein n=1 Tax=Aeromicrobium phragmitis TaxID=2478914 RepID=A0A3L8PI96_9ACTN|nr:S1 family peptidase [Aeromicrobium phragmitis]RLV55066.1 hypothetical protein D9V41_13315 [Aeromicrobium phragmitis]
MFIRTRRGVAAAGVAALALAMAAPAAFAEDNAPMSASGAAFEAEAKELLTDEAEGVHGVTTDGAGNVIVFADEEKPELEGKPNVEVKVIEGGFESFATTDVVGGAGYLAVNPDNGSAAHCSIGFSAWNPDGEPAILSAGHCTDDGALSGALTTRPATEPAGGGAPDNSEVETTGVLGELAASQFGGPGNVPGDEFTADETFVDISAYDVTNPVLDLLPEVTDWTTVEDLSQSTTPVKSVGEARVGEAVSKSGRTTGFSTGTVEGHGFALINGRVVSGFAVEGMTSSDAAPGDSGGAMIQGTTAVGLLSGGAPTPEGDLFVWGADLQNGLAQIPGYSVALDIDEPVMVTPADGGSVAQGSQIRGTGPAGRTLEVGIGGQNSGEVIEVAIDGNGNWSFPAPPAPGTYTIALTATDGGFNRSETVVYSIEVVLGAPAITSPADGSSVVDEVTAISGTGQPGALITLGGDAEGEATVGADGTWTVNVDLGIGAHTVTAVQTVDGEASPEVSSTFAVIPAAPVVTSPEHGVDYTKAPTVARGTGIDGAQIMVYLNGEHVGTTTVAGGEWSVELPEGLAAGDYDLRVVQTVNGQTNATNVSFGVLVAAAAPAPTGGLPATGAGVLLPLVLGGLALTAAGTAVAVRRRGRDEATLA